MVFNLHHTTGFILEDYNLSSIIQGRTFVKKSYLFTVNNGLQNCN